MAKMKKMMKQTKNDRRDEFFGSFGKGDDKFDNMPNMLEMKTFPINRGMGNEGYGDTLADIDRQINGTADDLRKYASRVKY